jgi:GT2 family glycosyltransferase
MSKAIIAMAVHDTVENGRTDLTSETIHGLYQSSVTKNYDVYCIDNGSCDATKRVLNYHAESGHIKLITNEVNIGTAEAVNKAWKHRKPDQHAVKMDNDVVIHSSTWVEEMIEAIEREPKIGIVGLKRKDCWERPDHHTADWRSELIMLPQQPGQRWMIAERCHHIIGTCQMYSAALLEKMGYLYQPSLYGYDDVLASHRSTAAGFWNVFLPHIEIDHIDPGGTEYQSWKEKHSSEVTAEMIKLAHGYLKGEVSIFYEPK